MREVQKHEAMAEVAVVRHERHVGDSMATSGHRVGPLAEPMHGTP